MPVRTMPGASRIRMNVEQFRVLRDGLEQRAVIRDSKEQGQSSRRRVCTWCLLETDRVLGKIHSDLPCSRCSREPCIGAIVEVTRRQSKRFYRQSDGLSL